MPEIHPTAIISNDAVIAHDAVIGPYCIINEGVTIGSRTLLGPHVRIDGPTTIGERNQFVGMASVGTPPQDLKFGGERTELVIGNDNTFREFVTISRGTVGGGGITTVGSHNFLMAYAHIAHDCHVGSDVIFANNATLAGHVEIGDHVTIGAFSAVHQFCKVGDYAFIGGATIATQNVLPYVKTVGSRPAKTYGVNNIGLQRKGFDKDAVEALQKAYRILVRSHLRLEVALERLDSELSLYPEVRYLAEFVRSSNPRGFIR